MKSRKPARFCCNVISFINMKINDTPESYLVDWSYLSQKLLAYEIDEPQPSTSQQQ